MVPFDHPYCNKFYCVLQYYCNAIYCNPPLLKPKTQAAANVDAKTALNEMSNKNVAGIDNLIRKEAVKGAAKIIQRQSKSIRNKSSSGVKAQALQPTNNGQKSRKDSNKSRKKSKKQSSNESNKFNSAGTQPKLATKRNRKKPNAKINTKNNAKSNSKSGGGCSDSNGSNGDSKH